MVKTYSHVWICIFAVFSASIFITILIVDYQKPSVFAAATTMAVFLALFTTLQTPISKIFKIAIPYVAYALGIIDRHRRLSIFLGGCLLTASIIGNVLMFNQLINKFRYVNFIRDASKTFLSENSSLPEPAMLAKAYILYPERREIPFIVMRVGRLFSRGGNWQKFIEYQKIFVEALEPALFEKKLCETKSVHYDPVIFIAYSIIESGVILQNDKPVSGKSYADSVNAAISFVEKCNKTINREIFLLKIKDDLNTISKEKKYDIASLENKLNQDIGNLSAQDSVDFYRSHMYQEYLDLKSYFQIVRITEGTYLKKIKDNLSDVKLAHEKIISNYRNILALRSSIGATGSVFWIASPSKINLFRFITSISGFRDLSEEDFFSELRLHHPELNTKIEDLAKSDAFKAFSTPDRWFQATPLDLTIEGEELQKMIEIWLQKDW